MARPKAKAPARTYHMSGQSIVRIDGKDFYLGKHDSPESIARYAVLIGIYQKHGLSLPDDFSVDRLDEMAGSLLGMVSPAATAQPTGPITVGHVTAIYREHVKTKYQHSEQDRQRCDRLCEILDERYAGLPVEDFGPVRLSEIRDLLIVDGLQKETTKAATNGKKKPRIKKPSRSYVNRLVCFVIGIFKHGVSKELVRIEKVTQLRTLEPLKYGQTDAPEGEETLPANLGDVRQTAKHLSPIIKSMMRIQIATGMRPKEIFSMRPCDINRRGEVWLYTPSSHKTKHKGKSRVIPIIGDAREAVIDYLARDPQAYLFSPAEATAWMRAVATANRTTKASYGNRVGTNRKADPQRKPSDQYTARSYRQAIQRAAKIAKVPMWHPYQLRHLTATTVRAALGGTEDAQALLGHSTALMTDHYARKSIEAATRAAKAAPKL